MGLLDRGNFWYSVPAGLSIADAVDVDLRRSYSDGYISRLSYPSLDLPLMLLYTPMVITPCLFTIYPP